MIWNQRHQKWSRVLSLGASIAVENVLNGKHCMSMTGLIVLATLLYLGEAFSIAKPLVSACLAGQREVVVYNGRGSRGALDIIGPLQQSLPLYNIRTITDEELVAGEWMANTALFVLPGGAATPYSEDLEHTGGTDLLRYAGNTH